jgi:hypothetical protein
VKPVQIEVIAPVLQGYGLCKTCELLFDKADLDGGPVARILDEYPQDWMEDYRRLSDWLADLSARYGERILIEVIDPQSLVGFFKCLRYRVRLPCSLKRPQTGKQDAQNESQPRHSRRCAETASRGPRRR